MPARRRPRSASARNSGRKDYIASTHRGHGHSIAKGCDVTAMMAELFGKQDGLCGGKGGSMHIADLDQGMLGANGIVGGGPPLVVGRGADGEDAGHRHRRGVVHRRRRLQPGHHVRGDEPGGGAASCRRSSCSKTTATANTPAPSYAVGSRDIAGRAAGFGLPAVKVSGDDFFAVHEAAREAVERARTGGGPGVIEVDTCRFYGHHSGDAQLYRGKDEVKGLREDRDCLKHFPARGSPRPGCWNTPNWTRSRPTSRR